MAIVRRGGGGVNGKDKPLKRRRYGSGCLYKRNGIWCYRWRERLIQADGSERTRHRSASLGRFRNQKEAEQARDRLLLTQGGANQPKAAMSLAEFWERYFVPEIHPSYKPATRAMQTSLWKHHVGAALGTFPLCDFTREQIQRFITDKGRQGLSPQTQRHLRNFLSAMFRVAVEWDWLASNPVRVRLPEVVKVRPPRLLSRDEIGKLFLLLPEPARTMFILGVGRGLRIGEMVGLEVGDLDFERGLLYVRRTVYRKNVGSPKTKKGTRALRLTPFLAEALRNYLSTGRPAVESPWLFCSPTGHYVHERNTMGRQIEPLCQRLGIPRFGWHSLRHTFSTYASEGSGASLPVLQGLLGHSDAETTMGYLHPLQESETKALERLEQEVFAHCSHFDLNKGLETTGPVRVH